MEWPSGPGTISDLVADARAAGHQANERLIRDWTRHGLLDYPQHRPAGKGHGSAPALYPAAQRSLFLTLLEKRPGHNVASLARIPVSIWMHWGEEWVRLPHARRALMRWLGDPDAGARYAKDALRTSRRRALDAAKAITAQIASTESAPTARHHLVRVLTDAGQTGEMDLPAIETAIRAVFEPGYSTLRRVAGHPDAPVMTESIIAVFMARLTAVKALTAGGVTDDQLTSARDAYLFGYAEYVKGQPVLAEVSPQFYAPVTAEDTIANSCAHLLSTLGLELTNPERAAELRAARAFMRRPTAADLGLAPG